MAGRERSGSVIKNEIKNTIIPGCALKGLQQLKDKIVHTCITSPPYFGLRDYSVDGQIGLEKTPGEYISKLVDVFREVKRVLRDDGTLWVNIGDSYAGSKKGAATHPENAKNYKQGTNRGLIGQKSTTRVTWGNCKDKDLIGIPWMLAFALRADGWYLRQDIIWSKTNCMPESVTDRCTKSHEYIFLLSKSKRYYFDNEAIKEPIADTTANDTRLQNEDAGLYVDSKRPRYGGNKYTATPDKFYRTKSGNAYDFHPLRNKRSVWHVSTSRFSEAHFATFPEDLIEPCVLSGCPKDGIVLDPFMGSGTTAVVAIKNGRQYIGCEINPEYIEMANRRISNTHYQIPMDISEGGK